MVDDFYGHVEGLGAQGDRKWHTKKDTSPYEINLHQVDLRQKFTKAANLYSLTCLAPP